MRFALSLLGTEVFSFEFGRSEADEIAELVRLGTETEVAEDSEELAYGFVPPEEATC